MNHQSISRFVTILVVSSSALTSLNAEIPRLVSHQGRIAVNGTNFDGTGQFKFLLYKHTDSDAVAPPFIDVPLWSNAEAVPGDLSEPPSAVSVPVTQGHYSLMLGDITQPNMAALPDNLVPDLPYDRVYLRIWFSDGSGFEQLAPDRAVVATPFALHADRAAVSDGVADGSIGSAALAAGAVTAGKIQAGAVSQLGTPNGTIADAFKMDHLGHAGLGTVDPQAALHVAGGSDVIAPELLSVIDGPRATKPACNRNGLLVIPGPQLDQLQFYDISDPRNPVHRATIANETAFNGHYYESLVEIRHLAFDPTGRILVIAAANQQSGSVSSVTFVQVDEAVNPAPRFQSIITDEDGDFHDLDNITAIASTGTDRPVLAIASYASAVTLIDLSDPTAPALLAVIRDDEGEFEKLDRPGALAMDGTTLAITSVGEHALTLVDLTTAEEPRLQAVLEEGMDLGGHIMTGLEELRALALRGGILAVAGRSFANGPDELNLLDVSSPSDPRHLATLRGGEGDISLHFSASSLAFSDDNVLAVGAGLSGLLEAPAVATFDLGDPAAPALSQVISDGQGPFGGIASADVLWAGSVLIISSLVDEQVTLVDPAAISPGAAGMLVEQRLGIGVLRPEATLHVSGDVRFDNAGLFTVDGRRISLGTGNELSSDRGVAIGLRNTAGYNGTAIGYGSNAHGGFSMAMGSGAFASKHQSIAIGTEVESLAEHATAIGYHCKSSGEESTAMGSFAIASGDRATAIGYWTRAEGTQSSAFGVFAKSTGLSAVALGSSNEARGIESTALGAWTLASGVRSTSAGAGTIAPSYGETALRVYNTAPTTVFSELEWDDRDRLLVIGNGSSDTSRSDLLTIHKDGRLQHSGSVTTLGNISTVSEFKYAFPRTNTYQVPASSFLPVNRETNYRLGDGFLHFPLGGGTSTGIFKAPAHLPDGATVTKLKFYYFDDWESGGGTGDSVYITNIQADLRRIGTADTDIASTAVASTFSTGTLNFPLVSIKHSLESTTTINNPVIDNANYQYWVELDFSVNTPSANLRFYGATISYTQDTVAP